MSEPLVSFVMIAYNQEAFIREAVESALSQTYSPLEVVISDDCSTDGTFAIIQDIAKSYRGPHQLVILRNPVNLGVGSHINLLQTIARGELTVHACGDDIFFPERTQKIVEYWQKNKSSFMSISSDLVGIDEKGVQHGQCLPDTYSISSDPLVHIQGQIIGSSHAWTKDIFTIFGPFDEQVIRDDVVIPFRASLLGSVHHISEPLLYYRVHDEGVWSKLSKPKPTKIEKAKQLLLWTSDQIACTQTMLRDLRTALQIRPDMPHDSRRIRIHLSKKLKIAKYQRAYLLARSRRMRLMLILQAHLLHFITPRITVRLFRAVGFGLLDITKT